MTIERQKKLLNRGTKRSKTQKPPRKDDNVAETETQEELPKSDFTIRDHVLVDHFYKQSPNTGGKFKHPPKYLVMHWTASGSAIGSSDYLCNPALTSASAHVVVGDNDHEVYQIVPFDTVAHHAGRSYWRGLTGLNQYSIGIEIRNWGWLNKTATGVFRTWNDQNYSVRNRVMSGSHKSNPELWKSWETYPPSQIDTLMRLTKAILDQYPSIVEIVGHDDISPGRKLDPGPAFPMAQFQALADVRDLDYRHMMVAVPALNIRSGPGVQHDKLDISPLTQNHTVKVLSDAGEWLLVEVNDVAHTRGWVHSAYLMHL